MTRQGEPERPTYADAIATLDAAIAALDAQDGGIGVDWGLRPGQWGYAVALEARESLRMLRHQMESRQKDES